MQTKFVEVIRLVGSAKLIRRHATANYELDYWHHRHRRKSMDTTIRRLAEKNALAFLASLHSGQPAQVGRPPPRLVISDAIDQFIQAHDKITWSKDTTSLNQLALKNMQDFLAGHGIKLCDQITRHHFNQLISHMSGTLGLSPKTIQTRMTCIKAWATWCAEDGVDLMTSNPFRSCTVPRARRIQPFCPTPAQVAAILHEATKANDLIHQVAIAISAYASLRLMEVLMLRPCDVDLAGGWIHVRGRQNPKPWTTKTGKDRSVPIHPKLATLLAAYLTPQRMRQAYILCANPSAKFPKGTNHLNEREVNLIAQRYAKLAGIPVGRTNTGFVFHSLRHHFETATINSQIPQVVVDQWMGHSGMRSMGNHYFNLTAQQSQKFMQQVVF